MYFGRYKKDKFMIEKYIFWSYILSEFFLFSISQSKMIFAETSNAYTEDV
jgi:hypothetical protein